MTEKIKLQWGKDLVLSDTEKEIYKSEVIRRATEYRNGFFLNIPRFKFFSISKFLNDTFENIDIKNYGEKGENLVLFISPRYYDEDKNAGG